jgi:D-alanyl-D-alanine carboxypeptidase/D-alanyl-D-alanine-endopeptidase (penicillin-binding protein 4)
VWLLAIASVLAWTPLAAAGLPEDIESAIRSTGLSATVAVSVRDADGGIELVSVDASDPMIPASNAKLLTTGAALHVLGPDFTFGTGLELLGDMLIVRGDGDPSFGDPTVLRFMTRGDQTGLDVESLLAYWVDAVAETQISRCSALVVDDRIFDRTFVHEEWPVDQLNRDYCAEVAGLNFHLNVVHFHPKPSGGRRPLVGTASPAFPDLQISNRAESRRGPNEQSTVWIARKQGTNQLTLFGNVPFPMRKEVAVTIHDPPAMFASLLAERLRATGIDVDAARSARADDALPRGRAVGPLISTPISTVVTRCNRDSENLYAEALLKRIGHEVTGRPGSWTNGPAVVRHVVHERLQDPSFTKAVVVTDGSGLSRANRISAAAMTAWLNSFHQDERLARVFIDSLAIGGEDGTLQKRFRGVDLNGAVVQAKSGYIKQVCCLSGYVTMPGGPRRSFSILINDLRGSIADAKRLQEQIVALVARSMTPAGVTLGSDR